MKLGHLVAALFGLWLAAPPLTAPEEPGAGTSGVVVESVRAGWPADTAGLKAGDILLSWTRAAHPPANPSPAQGRLRTPFDVALVEFEQGPRGKVRLLGLRGNRRMGFDLPPPGWGFTARPALSDAALTTYLEGVRRLEADRAQAADSWRETAALLSHSGRVADAAWLLWRVAELDARAKGWPAGRRAYEAAIRQAAGEGDWWARARLHDAYGTELLRRNEPARAADEYQKALDVVARRAPASLAYASALERLGALEESRDDLTRARDLYGRALALQQRIAPDSVAVAASLGALGHIATEKESTEDLCGRALALWERLAPGSLGAARTLNDLGELHFHRGDLFVSEGFHQRAYAIRKKLDPGGLELAASLHWLGNVAWRRGDFASAEDFHRRALAIRRSLAPGSLAVQTSLNSLGNLAGSRKDFESAERFHRQALRIGEKVAPDRVEAILHNLGEDARLRGDFARAEALFRRVLAMHESRPPGSGRSIAIANTLVSLAAVARDRGDLPGAETTIRRALAIREIYEPDTLHLAEDREVLADVLRARGRLAEARDVHEQILRVASRIAPGSELEARAWHGLGVIERKEGRLAKAAASYRKAIDALESQEGKLGGPPEARELFSAAYADYYRSYVGTLVELGSGSEAFWVLERSHARLLRTLLAERDLGLAADIPPALREERSKTDAEYDQALNRIREMSARELGPQREELLDRLAAIRTRRGEIIESIKRSSPHYASLRYPQPLDLAGTRASLDSGTLLLSYSIGREAAFLFAVEPRGAKGTGWTLFTLASDGTSLRESVEAYRNLLDVRAYGRSSPRDLLARSRSLYDTLIKPAESLIARYERLLILPDGPLHTLPFAALVRGVGNGKPEYLVEWKPVHTAVSATVYAELRKARKDVPRDPSVIVAAFGDPIYPKLPERKAAARRGESEDAGSVERLEEFDEVDDPQLRFVARGGFRFEPLPESRAEVETIASLYAPKAAVYLGLDATEEKARSIGKDVPLIHYACHAVINERVPLDSALVFTIPDKPREGQDNGLLQAWEIFERVRIDADLVTLSACESGLGKEMGGEGLIGLTRAFQYAGARSVLASLWKVEDKATGELMKRFYRYLKAGKSRDEALRSAQIDLIRSADFAQPKDWAAFQLNGDWK